MVSAFGRVPVPEPGWNRSWRTLWRWRPACWSCDIQFGTREEYDAHWLKHHASVPVVDETAKETP